MFFWMRCSRCLDPVQLLEGTTTLRKDQDKEGSNLDGGSPEFTYACRAGTSLMMMLDNGFIWLEYVGIAPKANCPLCLDDETTNNFAKEKL